MRVAGRGLPSDRAGKVFVGPARLGAPMRFNGWTALSLLVLLLGIGFWLYMGTRYNNWSDAGVYSVGIVLVGFGVAGLLASMGRRAPA